MTSNIQLSVIVPVRNEERHIRQSLEALADQDYPADRYEILVVDGRSTDRTRQLVMEFIEQRPDVQITLLDNPGQWSSRARNIGVRASRGQLIAVIDAHVIIPDRRLFQAMEQLQREHEALCLSRPAPLALSGTNEGMSSWIALARKSWLGHSQASYIYSDYEGFVDPESAGFAYDRAAFERAGLFDESFDAAEDVEFHHRLRKANILAYTSPRLTIYSYPRSTLTALFQQMTRYGEGRARLIRKHPDALTKETLVPPGILLYFALLPVALFMALFWPALAAGYLFGLALYIAILLATGLRAALPLRRIAPALTVSLAIWIIHVGLGWGFLRGLLRPGSPPVTSATDLSERSNALKQTGAA